MLQLRYTVRKPPNKKIQTKTFHFADKAFVFFGFFFSILTKKGLEEII